MKQIALTLCIFLSFSSFAATSSHVFETVDHQLYLAGETHIDDSTRSEFTLDLDIFSEKGGQVLALEMFETNEQPLLNSYMNRIEGSEEAMWEYLDRRWQYNTSSYMEMISHARDLGLELLAVDLPVELKPKETTIFPVIPAVSKVRAAREEHMAKILCSNFKKTVLIIGSFHTHQEFLPTALSKRCYRASYPFKLKSASTN